ncbi:g8102 [Coccomyxa elongata]
MSRSYVTLPFSSHPSTQTRCQRKSTCCVSSQVQSCSPLTRRRALMQFSVFIGSFSVARGAEAMDLESTGNTAADVLIADLLAKSKANKERYDKERLDSYYRRNYQDYFNFQRSSIEAGTVRGMSKELQEEILAWIRKNEKK